MGFIEVWGFDPDAVSRDRPAIGDERELGEFFYSNDDEEAAEIVPAPVEARKKVTHVKVKPDIRPEADDHRAPLEAQPVQREKRRSFFDFFRRKPKEEQPIRRSQQRSEERQKKKRFFIF